MVSKGKRTGKGNRHLLAVSILVCWWIQLGNIGRVEKSLAPASKDIRVEHSI